MLFNLLFLRFIIRIWKMKGGLVMFGFIIFWLGLITFILIDVNVVFGTIAFIVNLAIVLYLTGVDVERNEGGENNRK